MKLGPSGKRVRTGASFGLSAIWAETESVARLSGPGLARHHTMQALKSIFTSAVTSFLTVVTMAMALALLACVMLFFENTGSYIKATSSQLTLSLFLGEGAGEKEVQSLAVEIRKTPEVEAVNYRSKSEALQQFRKDLGQQASLTEGLETENPLPASLEVRFRNGARQEAYSALAARYSSSPLVEQVQYNEGVLNQLGSLLESIRVGGVMAVVVVLCMTVFIIGSTIKLALYSHRDEIEIMRLVGATDSFVQSPYIIEGALQGVCGSIIALVLVYGIFSMLRESISSSSLFSLLVTDFSYLSVPALLSVVILGLLAGVTGSYLTLRRFRVE